MLQAVGKIYFGRKRKSKISKIGKIAVIKSGAIGDVLMTTPMLRALRKYLPGTEIVYVVGRQSSSAIENNPNVDRVITFDVFDALGKNFLKMSRLAASLRGERFDAALVLDKSYLAGIFAYMAGIPVRIGFDRSGEGFANTHNIRYGKLRHEVDYYLDLLRFLKVKPSGRRMELFIGEKDGKFAETFFRKNGIKGRMICIAPSDTRDPGGLLSTRMWPDKNYASVASWASKNGFGILFVGSKHDIGKIKMIEKMAGVKTYSAAGMTTVRESAAIMAKCGLVLTHDAGPMHMASAAGARVVAVFGPTDPRRKAPPGSVSLWKGSKCIECEIFGKFPYCQNHPKTSDIRPEDVIGEIKRIARRGL